MKFNWVFIAELAIGGILAALVLPYVAKFAKQTFDWESAEEI